MNIKIVMLGSFKHNNKETLTVNTRHEMGAPCGFTHFDLYLFVR